MFFLNANLAESSFSFFFDNDFYSIQAIKKFNIVFWYVKQPVSIAV